MLGLASPFPWLLFSGGSAGVITPPVSVSPPVGIYDYATLTAAVAAWMNRQDLGPQMDSVLDLVEAKVRRTLRDRTIGPVSFVLTDGAALPDDCGELRTMALADSRYGNRPLGITTPTSLSVRQTIQYPRTGVPEMIAVIQNQVYVAPLMDGVYGAKITYYQTVPPLTAENPTNWLLTMAPDVYLYGMLAEFSAFMVEDTRVGLWASAFQTAMAEMERARERREYAARPLVPVNDWTF